jgi:hypothetical protein
VRRQVAARYEWDDLVTQIARSMSDALLNRARGTT